MPNLRQASLLLLILAFTLASAACRNRMGDDNGNANGNDNNGGVDELTDAQKAAIDDAFAHLQATAMALAGMIEGFGGQAEPQGIVQVGECPEVTFETVDGTVATLLDFGDGCTNEFFEEISASGSVTLSFGILSRTLDVDYADFTVDGQTTSGSLDLQITREDSQRTLTGAINISTTGVGSVSGSIEITLDLLNGTITVVEAAWTVTDDDDDTYSVEVSGVVVAPIDNGNFVPEAGSITFDYPGEGRAPRSQTITVQFDEESPVDGTVDVSIEGMTVEYALPAVQ